MKGRDRKEAYYLALANAEEMIRCHGEEGGIEQCDYEVDIYIYIEEKKKVAALIGRMADKYKAKHKL